MTTYLLENGYIDTNCQKAGVPGFSGCVKHATMIWNQIQKAKREKTDLHVVWLNLANAYGSVPHQLINYNMEFFHMPSCIKNMVASYFFLFWLSTEAVAFFTPRPPLFSLPACFFCLISYLLKRLSLHGSPNWKIMDLINWSLSAIDTIFSRRSLIEAVGRAVSNETETINRNMDAIMLKLTALQVKIDDFRDQNGQRG